MKTTNLLLLSFALVGVGLLSSCKKENRIERNLWKKGGEWNIESFASSQTSTYEPDNFDATISNYGTITFKEDGEGNYTFTADGYTETGIFNYSNTEDELTLIIDNQARVFDIIEWEKNEMIITFEESFVENVDNNAGSGTYIETYNLKKK